MEIKKVNSKEKKESENNSSEIKIKMNTTIGNSNIIIKRKIDEILGNFVGNFIEKIKKEKNIQT